MNRSDLTAAPGIVHALIDLGHAVEACGVTLAAALRRLHDARNQPGAGGDYYRDVRAALEHLGQAALQVGETVVGRK